MSNYIVSARKYRPSRFDEVVGQQQVTRTLKNAIKNDKIAQAFLFCGPRGVGKTTCARILAKTINCQNLGSDIEACGECESCKSFQSQSSFNIHELDAASNNSVEDMRSLTEQVRYPPQTGDYKIYIIDEVHMLSQSAFNAFLKTLEEPPPYAIFILATTEKHRILPTILSRCQIFDFNRIDVKQIVSHLKDICEKENLDYEEDALHIIGQKADGALRDALSIFDRLVSFSEGKLTYEQVLENLNILDYDYYFKITDALLSEDRSAVLNYFNEILQKGFEGETFTQGLSQHFRDLLMCKDPTTIPLLEVSENLKERYGEQAAYSPSGFLLSALDIANKCGMEYRYSKNKRLTVELALMKMCYLSRAIAEPAVEVATDGNGKKKAPSEPVAKEKPSQESSPKISAPRKIKEEPAEQETPPVPDYPGEETKEKKQEAPDTDKEDTGETTEKSKATEEEPQKVEEPNPRPKRSKKKKKLLGGLSASHDDLMSELNEEQKEEASENGTEGKKAGKKELPNLSKEEFTDAWKLMVEKVRTRDDTTLLTILESYEPEFVSGHQVKMAVSNKVELQLMKDEKIKITGILGEILNQTNLELLLDYNPEIQANEEDEDGQKHYTVNEKMDILKKANPQFEELRKKLGLEPDF